MAQTEGYVKVYESSDGGTGNPVKTLWHFFVGNQPVTTENRYIADTIQLAINTKNKVQVTFGERTTISQARIEFRPFQNTKEAEMPEPVSVTGRLNIDKGISRIISDAAQPGDEGTPLGKQLDDTGAPAPNPLFEATNFLQNGCGLHTGSHVTVVGTYDPPQDKSVIWITACPGAA